MQWKIAGELPPTDGQEKSLGVAGPVAGVSNDVLLVAGGANFPDAMPWQGGKKKYYREGFVFKKRNDSLDCFKRFQLPYSMAYSANCSTPAGIVAAGGEAENGISSKVLLLGWNSKTESVELYPLPDLPLAVTNAAIACRETVVYLAGGETKTGVSNRFFRLDLENVAAGWNELPSLRQPVSNAVMMVQSNGQNDCVYLIGGRKKNAGSTSDLYASVFQFDLSAGQWQEKRPLPYALSAGTGIAAGDNGIFVFGGDRGETFHKTELLIAEIAGEKDEVKKGRLNEQKASLQASHPGFSKEVLLYNTKKDKWTRAGCIPFDTPVTTTAVQWDREAVIPSGEVRAGVRTSKILMVESKR
ncbi:MAG TPA: kelch repeat-containing protein [Flavisolibacter sp.]|nr:kelch repeat-containing protein [Flavisolibacter sp.]